MDVRVLGSLQVARDGHPLVLGGRRQRLVLAVLVERAGHPVSAGALIDAVWGDHPPVTARKTLQVYVSRLRAVIGHERIDHVDDGYVLCLEPGELDADRFEALAREGHASVAGDPSHAVVLLSDALALWRGTPWGDLGDHPALAADVARLGELRVTVVEDRLEAQLALGDATVVVGELETLVERHPFREHARQLLMLALYRSGQQARALAVFDETRRLLAEELGVDPGPDLVALHDAILHQDPRLLATRRSPGRPQPSRPPARATHNPYKGMSAFGEDDADDFFGRDELVDEVVARLRVEPMVTLVGPSGSGKSSVARAGVVPARRAAGPPGWSVVTIVPGEHTLDDLVAALAVILPEGVGLPERRHDGLDLLRAVLAVRATGDRRVLVVLDQFEQLFVHDDAAAFVGNLVEALEDPTSGLSVLATLRADFLDRPLAHPRLARLVRAGQVTVLPLEPAELEEAVVAPAARVGVTVEPELAAQLVAGVADRPGALPLLQFTLTELFDRRTGGVLGPEDLERLGGLDGIVARQAEEVFRSLPDADRQVARQVFLHLVTVASGQPRIRRRVGRDELAGLVDDGASVDALLERFGAARLVTFDRDSPEGRSRVELPHEALIEAWPRLRRWIDESRSDLRREASLATAARDWVEAGRDDDWLLSGERAEEVASWAQRGSVGLTPDERAFVEASVARVRRARAAEVARRTRQEELERRALRRLRVLVGVLLVALVVGAGLTGLAVDRGRRAAVARDAAVVLEQLARVDELTAVAVSLREQDFETSLLLLRHAVEASRLAGRPVPATTVTALHLALQAARVPFPATGDDPVVVDTPVGPRGIFPLPLPVLLDLASDAVQRQLTTAECRTWLDVETCPTVPGTVPAGVRAEDPVPRERAEGEPPLAGTEVRLLTPDAASTRWAADFARIEADTGVSLQVDTESWAFEDVAVRQVGEGIVDLVISPQPAAVAELAAAGQLQDLSRWMDREELVDELSPHLVALGSVAPDGTWPSPSGPLYGLPQNLDLKSLVWYPAQAFDEAGYAAPTTQAELDALVDRMVADGRTPWCHGEGAGEATGWPGTDWIEDLVLQDAGVGTYDDWVSHGLAFGAPPVRAAFERYAALVLSSGHLWEGQRSAAAMPPSAAIQGLFTDPPSCWLMHAASFAPIWFPVDVQPGDDVGALPFPAVSDAGDAAVLGAGGFVVAVTDRPEVRAAVAELVGDQWGREAIEAGEWVFMANRHVPVDAYPDPGARAIARTLQTALAADRFRFDGSDLMPTRVQEAFWDGMERYTGYGPDNLDQVLADVDAAWADR